LLFDPSDDIVNKVRVQQALFLSPQEKAAILNCRIGEYIESMNQEAVNTPQQNSVGEEGDEDSPFGLELSQEEDPAVHRFHKQINDNK
jgi:hypothetical protein